jgi:hypothetical protein
MALNPSGAISLGGSTAGQSINLENGQPATAQVSLNDAAVRSLAGVPTGVIIMPTDFYGKANLFTFSISTNASNVNLRSAAISAGWPGSGAVSATINPGVTIHSTSTGGYALTIDGSWPGGISLTNNGTIVGAGGSGGAGGTQPARNGIPGTSAGAGILASVPVTIDNASGIIAGGGGGGGGGAATNARGGSFGGVGGGGVAFGAPNGTLTTGGAGGDGSGAQPGGVGGVGGGYASTGGVGGGPPNGFGGVGGAGGAGGNSLSGNPLVTFPALGTIYGPRV